MLDKDIIEFIESMADFGGILTISNEFNNTVEYLSMEEIFTLLEDNENIDIDMLFDDILYFKIGNLDASKITTGTSISFSNDLIKVPLLSFVSN